MSISTNKYIPIDTTITNVPIKPRPVDTNDIAPLDIYFPEFFNISLKVSVKVDCSGPKSISYWIDISLIKVIIPLNRFPNWLTNKGIAKAPTKINIPKNKINIINILIYN